MNDETTGLQKVDYVAKDLGITKFRAYERTRAGEFDSFLVVIGERQYRYDPQRLAEWKRRGGTRERKAIASQD